MSDERRSSHAGLLAERVAWLEAEAGIRETLARYGHAIDAGDEDGWVDLFTETGEFQVRGPGGSEDDYTIAGRTELRDFYSHHSRRPEAFHEHVTVAPVITLTDDGRRASCRSRFFVIVMDAAHRPVIRVFGTYQDTLERAADGTWRFATRRPEIDAQAPDLPPLAYSR